MSAPLTLDELAPTPEDWARSCDTQAEELETFIKNFLFDVPQKSECVELVARLRLRAAELRRL